MTLTNYEQLQKLFQDCHCVLITFPNQDNGEATSAALALKAYLEKQSKQVDIVSHNFVVPKNLHFLQGSNHIKSALTHLQKFIIKIDISQAKVDSISYDIKDGQLSINITPRQGTINKDNLRTAQSGFKYDLIITLCAPDLSALGNIFLSNTDLFYRTPTINIDTHPGNEHYGQINMVEMTASGCGEIIYKFLKQSPVSSIAPEIATQLLASLIIATKSFKTTNVNPTTLNYASELMTKGGDREKIIRSLYHTRSLSALKLWGTALSSLKHEHNLKMAYLTISRDQFAQAGAEENDIKDLAEELISTAPEAELIMVLYESKENNQTIKGTLIAEKNHDAKTLLAPLNPHGDKQKASFEIRGKNLADAEKEVLELLKK
ncbi:MAG: hypothetical protein Q7S24_01260 [bacterium]|nr:hypothetical protein [bacterium]